MDRGRSLIVPHKGVTEKEKKEWTETARQQTGLKALQERGPPRVMRPQGHKQTAHGHPTDIQSPHARTLFICLQSLSVHRRAVQPSKEQGGAPVFRREGLGVGFTTDLRLLSTGACPESRQDWLPTLPRNGAGKVGKTPQQHPAPPPHKYTPISALRAPEKSFKSMFRRHRFLVLPCCSPTHSAHAAALRSKCSDFCRPTGRLLWYYGRVCADGMETLIHLEEGADRGLPPTVVYIY